MNNARCLIPPTNYVISLSSTFHIPSRFHPAYSLLGRWIRHRADDRWQAGARYLVALGLLLTAALIAHMLAWGLGHALFEVDAAGARYYAAAQLTTLVLLGLVCVLGFQPGITVRCTPEGLHLRQGRRTLHLPYAAITSAASVPALQYHRHYRRYAATTAFANRLPDPILLLHTRQGPVALGLSPTEQRQLCTLLEHQRRASSLQAETAGLSSL